MSNILKDLIKKALKEVDDAAMKKSAKGMAMYGKKAKMKEQDFMANVKPSPGASGGQVSYNCVNNVCQPVQGLGGDFMSLAECQASGCEPNPEDFGGGVGHPGGPGRLGKKRLQRRRKIREAEVTAGDENTKFNLKVDVSNPQSETKLGVRIQLEPKEGFLEPEAQDNLETALMKKLNNALEQFDIQVSKDTDVPDPTVIGFFIPLSQIKNMIVKSIKGPGGTTTPKPFTPDLEKDALQRDKISQMMDKEKQAQTAKQTTNESINDLISDQLITEMRQRTLNEISQIVLREDFYGFVNAGNNMLRSLEERGYDMREAKKYLGYLVKHNIM